MFAYARKRKRLRGFGQDEYPSEAASDRPEYASTWQEPAGTFQVQQVSDSTITTGLLPALQSILTSAAPVVSSWFGLQTAKQQAEAATAQAAILRQYPTTVTPTAQAAALPGGSLLLLVGAGVGAFLLFGKKREKGKKK